MAKVHLTAAFVSNARCPEGKDKVHFIDSSTRGLVFEVRASGGMTFYVKYLNNRGKTRWYRLGYPQDLTLLQIRALADKIRNQLALGIDPAEGKAAQKSTPSFGDFVENQYLPHIKSYKRSWETDVSILKNHLLPRFTKKYLDEISRADITKLLNERVAEGAKPGTVNRSLIMMRYIFNLAVRWEVPGAHFSDRGHLFQADRGRRFRAIVDAQGMRASEGLNVSQSSKRSEAIHREAACWIANSQTYPRRRAALATYRPTRWVSRLGH